MSKVADDEALVHRQLALDANAGTTPLAPVCWIHIGCVNTQSDGLSDAVDRVKASRKRILLALIPVPVKDVRKCAITEAGQ